MRRILIGLAMAVAGIVIALGVRADLAGRSPAAAPGVMPAETRAQAAPRPGRPGAPLSPDDTSAGMVAPAENGAPAASRAGEIAPRLESADTEPGSRVPSDAQDAKPAESQDAKPAASPDASSAAAAESARTRVNLASESAPLGPADASASDTRDAAAAPAQAPTAETVLRRASAAYGKIGSLRADFVQQAENPLLRSRVTSRGTLYQRRPDRFLMRFSDPAGDVIVSDGRHIWVYYPSVDEQQVIRTLASAAGAGGVDLQAQFLGDPLARFAATLDGTESVNGRSAYVLQLTPREPTGYRSLRVWVDTRDYLVRRFKLVEESGLAREFELDGLTINPELADSLFRFTPPPGARIVDRG